jgi:hypothetical protein
VTFQVGAFQPSFQGDGGNPLPLVSASGGRVRKARFACEVDGEWLFFDSLDELYDHLDELKEKELEVVEKKVEKVIQKVVRTGKAPSKAAPKIQAKGIPQEAREYVDEINAEISKVYWTKVAVHLAERADEDDIEILLGVI